MAQPWEMDWSAAAPAQQAAAPWERDWSAMQQPPAQQESPRYVWTTRGATPRAQGGPAQSRKTLPQIGEEWKDLGRGAAIGVPSGVFGAAGDIEGLGRLALSPLGVESEPFLPTTDRVGNWIAGPPENEHEARGRTVGSMFGPTKGASAVMRGGRHAAGEAADAFSEAGRAAYKRADDAGVIASQPSFKAFVDDLKVKLADEGIDEGLNPKAVAALNYLEKRTGENITLKGLDIARRNIGRVARLPDDGERAFGMMMKTALDDYLEAVAANPGAHVIMGDAKAGTEALNEARGLWARARQSELIDDLVSRAELSASKYSQSGLENAIRSEFRAVAKNKDKMRGLPQELQDAIRTVAQGGPIDNALRLVGKFKPTGVVSSMPSLLVGEHFGPMAGMALAGVGAGARSAATAATMRNVEAAAEAARRGAAVPSKAPNTTQMLPPSVLAALLAYRVDRENK